MYTKIHKFIYCKKFVACCYMKTSTQRVQHVPKSRKGEKKTKGRIAAFYLSTQNGVSSLYALYLIMSFKTQNKN